MQPPEERPEEQREERPELPFRATEYIGPLLAILLTALLIGGYFTWLARRTPPAGPGRPEPGLKLQPPGSPAP